MTKLLSVFTFFMNFLAINNAHAFDIESMQTPEIRQISLISFSAEKHTAVFDVDVYNPNEQKIPVRELTGKIYINQRLISTIEANSKKSLAAHSTQTFRVPIDVDVDTAQQAANNVMITGDAFYAFKGYMMTPIGELPINETGQLTAEQILTFIRTLLFSQSLN
jgi:LEA14-like dessication related protein